MDGKQVSFMLTKGEKELFDAVSRYYETSKTELLRQWIYNQGTEILEPMVDEAIRMGVDEDERNPLITKLRREEIQVHVEGMEAGDVLVGILDAG